MQNVLVIEDDPDIMKLVRDKVVEEGFTCETAVDGLKGLELALAADYSVVILDLTLPSMSGLDVCRQLRQKKPGIPILILTSRAEEADKVLGLEVGADDYMTKPFGVRELIARVRSLIRRSSLLQEQSSAPLRFAGLEIDAEKRRVSFQGKGIELTTTEFDILLFLASNPGRPFTRDELMEHVWGYQASGFEPTITTHLSRLRAKLEPEPSNPTFIKTVRGFGYCFTDRDDA